MSSTIGNKKQILELVKPVIIWDAQGDARGNGSAFPIACESGSVWYLTCAHVVKLCGDDPSKTTVGGVQAKEVIIVDETKVDLALIRIEAAELTPLRLWPVFNPPRSCRIPCCHRLSPNTPELVAEPRLADIEDSDLSFRTLFSGDGSCAMPSWALNIKNGGELKEGDSGSPVICEETAWVFAVAAWNTDYGKGKGGIAISIANLKALLPERLRWVLPATIENGDIFSLLASWRNRIHVQEIREICRRSLPLPYPLDWLKGDDFLACCEQLIDHQKPFEYNKRSPLYDVLAELEMRAEADEKKEIQAVMGQLIEHYRSIGLTTTPLSPCRYNKPAVVEIVFDPQGSQSQKGYAVRSYWHDPNSGRRDDGPRRDNETMGGELLEIGHTDSRAQSFPKPVQAYVGDLIDALGDWGAASLKEIVFVFRLPGELLSYPVECWPKTPNKALGHDHAVVVAARESKKFICSEYWHKLEPRLEKPLGHALWWLPRSAWPTDEKEIKAMSIRIKNADCPVILQVPDQGLLEMLVKEGVSVALWPRDSDAVTGLKNMLGKKRLTSRSLTDLRFILRELRNNPGKHISVIRHLVLLWDDPGLHQSKKPFLPGLN